MSPLEENLFRFIFALDNLLVILLPWLKVVTISVLFVVVTLFLSLAIRTKQVRRR